nr:MAG TPA: hypothetical protein [Caudoviricetes sp.]
MSESITNVAIVAIVFVGTLIKIPKLEVNVWGLIGKGINKDINAKLDTIMAQQRTTQEKLETHIAMDDERYAISCRTRILRFNDELLHRETHTKEHFDQVLSDITAYDSYCKQHPEFQNQITVHASKNILQTYDKCTAESSFL